MSDMKNLKRSAFVLFALIALLCVGCTDPAETRVVLRTDTDCKTDTAKERADFILQCIENANPKSDEEPEDWIMKCQAMAENTLCEKAVFEVVEICGSDAGCFWREISRKPHKP